MIHSNHARLWELILDAIFLLLDLKLGKLMRDPSDSENVTRPWPCQNRKGGRGIATFCKDVQNTRIKNWGLYVNLSICIQPVQYMGLTLLIYPKITLNLLERTPSPLRFQICFRRPWNETLPKFSIYLVLRWHQFRNHFVVIIWNEHKPPQSLSLSLST